MGWLALVCLMVYIASFAVGLGRVFWRNWSANSVVASFFLTLTSAISREGAFWVYAGLGVLALIFFVARLPETEDRSPEEIERDVVGATG